MKKISIAAISVFSVTALVFAAATFATPGLSDKELGIGAYSEHASVDTNRLSDKELGIGAYSEHASVDSNRPTDKELGIGQYSDHA